MRFGHRPKLSIILNTYNMRREAPRTLYSLSKHYQKHVNERDYEVLIVDNGSKQALDKNLATSFGNNFHYHYIDSGSTSPCKALNTAARLAKGEWLMSCIDGARILSPGILHRTLQATHLHNHPFIYTLGMHLGEQPQNLSVQNGYNQVVEDQLLETIDWRTNGYQLFSISSLALSSGSGFFSTFAESNCFCMKKTDYLSLNGFDEAFDSPGGGLVNLDFFNRVHENPCFQPILLLGEATFHQFHGGVATNVSLSEHPWDRMETEYKTIRGKAFTSHFKTPDYFGTVNEHTRSFF